MDRQSRYVLSCLVLLFTSQSIGCGVGSDTELFVPSRINAPAWQPVLTDEQVTVVRNTFSEFQPELFLDGKVPAGSFVPSNFTPAFFLGPPRAQGTRPTPRGVAIETNGFDLLDKPEFLSSTGTYFDRALQPFSVNLGETTLSPLNELEARMQVPFTTGAPVIRVDRRKVRLDVGEVESILFSVRDALALRFPQIADVDPRNAEIVIEPSIFYVRNSNLGDGWAGGLVTSIGGGRYRIHVMVFYVSGQRRVADWREYLISEAINFYVLSIGRPDLAR